MNLWTWLPLVTLGVLGEDEESDQTRKEPEGVEAPPAECGFKALTC